MYDLGVQFHYDTSKLLSKPESMIIGNHYRFTVLTERLIRLEYDINSNFNNYATELVTFRNFDSVKYDVKEDSTTLQISTSYFTLTYLKESNFKAKPKSLTVKLNNTDNVWYYGHPEARNYYGSSVSVEIHWMGSYL